MRTVFLGDSITAGWNVAGVGGGPNINSGIPANRTHDMAARFLEDALQYDPDRIVLLGGINDLLWDPYVSVAAIVSMARRATRQGVQMFVGTLLPCSDFTNWRWIANLAAGKAAVSDFNTRIRGAASYGYTVIDYYPSFVNADDTQKTSLFNADGLHLNASGYALLTSIAAAALGS